MYSVTFLRLKKPLWWSFSPYVPMMIMNLMMLLMVMLMMMMVIKMRMVMLLLMMLMMRIPSSKKPRVVVLFNFCAANVFQSDRMVLQTYVQEDRPR